MPGANEGGSQIGVPNQDKPAIPSGGQGNMSGSAAHQNAGPANAVNQNQCSPVSDKINIKRQLRHVKGTQEWKDNGERSYVESISDAQAVLSAYHSGDAKVVARTREGNLVVNYKGVTGYNVNRGAGYPNQPTNNFMIKGTKNPNVVPTQPAPSPTWIPGK